MLGLRNMLLALLFGLGFASAAQRWGSDLPLIDEWLLALSGWSEKRQQKRVAHRAMKNTEPSPELDQMLSDLGGPAPEPEPTTDQQSTGR